VARGSPRSLPSPWANAAGSAVDLARPYRSFHGVLSEHASGTTVDAIAESLLHCADLGQRHGIERPVLRACTRSRHLKLLPPGNDYRVHERAVVVESIARNSQGNKLWARLIAWTTRLPAPVAAAFTWKGCRQAGMLPTTWNVGAERLFVFMAVLRTRDNTGETRPRSRGSGGPPVALIVMSGRRVVSIRGLPKRAISSQALSSDIEAALVNLSFNPARRPYAVVADCFFFKLRIRGELLERPVFTFGNE
jgi:hypothetical protein